MRAGSLSRLFKVFVRSVSFLNPCKTVSMNFFLPNQSGLGHKTWRNVAILIWLASILGILYRHPKHCQCPQQLPNFGKSSFFNGVEKNPKWEKIDWHDYKFMAYEEQRRGNGENGSKAINTGDVELEKKLYAVNGYSGYLSDLVSVNRSLPDKRPKG
jgi:hypothetical protein